MSKLNNIKSINSGVIQRNQENEKQLILPALNDKYIKRKSEIVSPVKSNIIMLLQNKNSNSKQNPPITGANLFKEKYTNFKENKNKNFGVNNNNNLSNRSGKKRAISDFKHQILQTINNNNNWFNNKNIINNYNNCIPLALKNNIKQNTTALIGTPKIKNKYKSLDKQDRNISSYNIGVFPIIND